MNPTSDKVRANRLRRHAARLGLRIEKSRAKRLHSNDFGLYQVLRGSTVLDGVNFEMTLDQVEAALEREEESLRAR